MFSKGDENSLNERLKQIRKALNLSQEEFGKHLGVTKASISRLEAGINNVTDQMTKSICREYNIDFHWFTTGEGEMFAESDLDVMALIDRVMTGENEFHKKLFQYVANFTKEDLLALEHVIHRFKELSDPTDK